MSATATPIKLDGRDYMILARAEYDRLTGLAKAIEAPPLPEADARGNYPAIEYARASLARNLIRDRVNLGLTQQELADLAGVRIETVCRLERGKHTPSIPTLEKIDRALKRAAAKGKHAGGGNGRKGR